MRKNAKWLVSAVIAAVMAASLSISAFAAVDDSSAGSNAPTTPSSSSSATQSEISAVITASGSAEPTSVDSAAMNKDITSAISSASGSDATVTVKSTQNLRVNSSVVKELANSDGTVLKIVSPKAVISIDSSTIKKARRIDLSMKIVNTTARTRIVMSSKKDFGCEVKITVTSCKMSAEKLASAHVYCDDEDLGPVEINEDGNPVITVTKGGTYIIK